VHVYDPDKGRFVQVHSHKLPSLPTTKVKKRQRNREYVKYLHKKEQESKPLSEEELAAKEAERERAEEQRLANEQIRKEKEAERKRAQEEEKTRKEEERRQAEEAEQKRKEEEKRKAEEAKQKRQEEERRKAEEAEKKRKADEEKRQAEEAEKKRKAEDEERRQAEEAEKKLKAEAEEAKRKAEEAEKKRKAEEEEKRKAEEAEKKRKAKEEEEKRKAEEAEKKRKAEEEEKRKTEEAEKKHIRRKKSSDALKAAVSEGDIDALKAAVEDAKEACVDDDEVDTAEEKLQELEHQDKVFADLRMAVGGGDAEILRGAIAAAKEAGVVKDALEDAEEALAELDAEADLEKAVDGQDLEALKAAIARAEELSVGDETLEKAKDKVLELEAEEEKRQEAREKQQKADEEKEAAEDALADAAGGTDIEALAKAIERAEAAAVDAESLEEARERLAELEEEEKNNAKADEPEEEDEKDWENKATSPPGDEDDAPSAPNPEDLPKISATAYREWEAEGGSKMSASAPEFVPGQGGWTVNLVKTNPDAVKSRRKAAPPISKASQRMPTYERKDWILGTVRRNTVTVISGDTGCGKSTLIPQLICDAENLIPDDKVIVCTQPRRIAAITLAQYVAADREQQLGDDVGYQIRFVNAFSEHTRLIYATTAIILRRLHSEPSLESIGCLIVDEVHERDVYTDFVLLLIREAMLAGKMQHLKIVLMSATLKADDFAQYFQKINGDLALKPVHVPGRMFPVEDYYWEDACEWLGFSPPLPRANKGKGKGKKGSSAEVVRPDDNQLWKIYDAIKACDVAKGRPGAERADDYGEKTLTACWCWKENEVYIDLICELVKFFHEKEMMGDGAILIFLPGWGDISKIFIQLYNSGENYKLIALHSLMTPEQQQEAFERPPKGKRKVVLSTNIAEASVTIDDVVYVIDCGVRKERSYNPETGVSSLDAKMVSKANAIQRKGRAGRVQAGLVVHLFPSYKMTNFEEFPLPQMLTSSMDEVVLQSKVICGTSNDDIAGMLMNSMASPQREAITNAVEELKSIDCLTREGELTALGRACASIPVQPNVAKMLLLAGAFRCIKTAAVVAAFLSVKNPFQQSPGQPGGGRDGPKKKTGKEYFNKGFHSDHLTALQAYVEWRKAVKGGYGDEFCDEQGLSPETMDMAHMMAQQFTTFMQEANYDGMDVREEDCPPIKRGTPDDALLRCALTAGFAPGFVVLYAGNRSPYWYIDTNSEVWAFPGSVNRDYQMTGKDGDEWMVYSDSMVMGRGQSIMDSSLVLSPFVLLFSRALMIKGREVRFDRWWAEIDPNDSAWKELLELRKLVIPNFKEAIEGRDLSLFPKELTERMATFCMRPPIRLQKIEACRNPIDQEVSGAERKKLSMYEWPIDEGPGEDEEE